MIYLVIAGHLTGSPINVPAATIAFYTLILAAALAVAGFVRDVNSEWMDR